MNVSLNCSVSDWPPSGPPEGSPWAWLHEFVKDIARLMSLSDAMEKHSMDRLTYSWLVSESPWFCEQLKLIKAIKRTDAELATIQAGIGHKMVDDDGKTITDADGVPIRKGRDSTAAKFILERSPASIAGDLGQQPDFPDVPPLLPSNADHQRQLQIDDCHMALNALRPAVRAGDRQAIDTFIKTQDRLAKLQGTDAPKQNVTYLNTDGTANLSKLSDAELDAVVRQSLQNEGLTLVQGADGTYSVRGKE